MRLLKILPDAVNAQALAESLHGAGVAIQTREAPDGGVAVWVLDESDLPRSRTLLNEFEQTPDSPHLRALRREAAELRRVSAARSRDAGKNEVDVRSRWRNRPSSGRVSMTLIGLCVAVFLLTGMGSKTSVVELLTIATLQEVLAGQPFASLLSGQIWRLLTPIFLHFGLMHIVFNMLWLNDLGSALEAHRGGRFLLLMVVLIGIVSNLAQYLLVGIPRFGGMSGVVYGMLGYVWLRGRFDPRSGLQLNRLIVILMLAWLVLGFTGLMRELRMANIAHLSGLMLGCVWGYLSSGDLRRRLGRR